MLDISPGKHPTTPNVAIVPYILSSKHLADAFKKQSLTERLLSTTELDQILIDIQAISKSHHHNGTCVLTLTYGRI